MNNDLNTYEDGSLPLLDIGKSLDGVSEQDKMNFLTLCCKKLAYGGTFKLQGIHLDSFCKNYLFGPAVNIAPIYQLQSVTSLTDLQQILQQHGLKVQRVQVAVGVYTVEATK